MFMVQKKKKIETHVHFERPCNKLKKCNFIIENTKIKIGNLKKFKDHPILCLNFKFISVIKILIFGFQI